jgi:hypothetical protein
MKIKNISGTSDTNCVCGSWLEHWKKFSGQSVPTYCPANSSLDARAATCINKDLVGAHVQKADSSDQKWYIYPLCNAHNQFKGVLEVNDTYKLVSANKQETCEKKSAFSNW